MTPKDELDETVQGAIFDIQRMSIHDGPGIRTTVFLKGCPLHCAWCHNPEGYVSERQLAFTPALCIACGFCVRRCPNDAHAILEGRHRFLREKCRQCFACVAECYSGALEVVGKTLSVSQVLEEVIRDKPFYDESGGGMTLGGGEPLAQFEFTLGLLHGAKRRGLHTCLETSGVAPTGRLEELVPLVDIFLFDYKETDPERHKLYTGQSNERILQNLRFLDSQNTAIILRCPIIPQINLREDHLRGIVEIARSLRNCQAVHVMGYHALAAAKRARLGIPRPPDELANLAEMPRHEVQAVIAQLRTLWGPNGSTCPITSG